LLRDEPGTVESRNGPDRGIRERDESSAGGSLKAAW
jgi:hypothetical protein